jgi:hypothetical protein
MNSYIGQSYNKGQASQVGSPSNVLKNINDLENLDREIPYSFLRKKAEKLSTAVYLITSFLSDSEPMKWQIRECGLGILSDVISVANPPVSEMVQHIKGITSGIGKIISLFEIAAVAGFISEMNLSILKEEYLSLVEVVENRKVGRPEGRYVFSREFFESREPIPSLVSEKEKPASDNFYKGQTKKNNEIVRYDGVRQDVEKVEQPHVSSSIPESVSENSFQKKAEKSSRRETILRLIKDKGDHTELSIKDIAGHFFDCGEKTIQRELTALVDEGILKKTGERRWSRYSFQG